MRVSSPTMHKGGYTRLAPRGKPKGDFFYSPIFFYEVF